MEKLYIAHALILENGHVTSELFCGLFKNRKHAHDYIKETMSTAGSAEYVPQVRVAEVLDDNDLVASP
jgi:hypothetical protein